jgi:hypothetical protein
MLFSNPINRKMFMRKYVCLYQCRNLIVVRFLKVVRCIGRVVCLLIF